MTAKGEANIKVGLFGIGLETYWPQFKGLLKRLEGYQAQISQKMAAFGVTVVDAGMVDSVPKAKIAADLFKREDVEIIFLFISTYALSSTVLPVVHHSKVPVVVLNLQPDKSFEYDRVNAMGDRGVMTGEFLANCQACSAPEIACAFNRANIDYHLVTGYLNDEVAWHEIQAWVDAAKVALVMRNNRVGVLGHYYCGMLDVYSDLTQQTAVFGSHFELLEMCELYALREKVTESQVDSKVKEFRQKFSVSDECEEGEIRRAAKTSCALDALVAKHRLGSMAYYYEGTDGNPYENMVTSIIAGNSLLTARNIPVAGECEIKNAQAMKIMDTFGVGGSFSEFYLMDFEDDAVLLGHDGPAHFGIAQGKVGLVPLPVYHGKPGKGLSIQMTVKYGPVTLLSVVQDGQGKVSLLVAEGESVPGPVMQIGNTNSRYRFSIGTRGFMDSWCKAGPAHHCAIGTGHIGYKLKKLAAILGIECKVVC